MVSKEHFYPDMRKPKSYSFFIEIPDVEDAIQMIFILWKAKILSS